MEYNHTDIEKKWQDNWRINKTYKATENPDKPKFYVLDMFPYPSGAGLHVGHPLGYIASDIYARYKRLKGFNVLHPMGYDSFGLPAEQYAIQTGQHPAITTETNIKRYRQQLDQMGFAFDWDREVRTSDPSYYKWTQWIFKQLFNSWYNNNSNKAEDISTLIALFEQEGNATVNACQDECDAFTAADWKGFSEEKQQTILLNYRLTYLSDTWVNWCEALGTVLANDEIKDGLSERGGHSVVQKRMRQWSMRIKAYAERLLTDLDGLEWTDAIKDIQRNWIGKSVGASVNFQVDGFEDTIEVFTTRPDTIFGVSFMTLAPEHALVNKITTAAQEQTIADYQKQAAAKSERDRQSDVKNISGAFTGAYAVHPFNGELVPIWIGDYVLATYGTGAVMAVPCGDQRDYDFAKHFDITINNIFKDVDISEGACDDKNAVITNSDFLNDLPGKKATKLAIYEIEKRGLGKGQTNYRLRNAVFSRQRYWGEPFPVYYKNDIPYMLEDGQFPELPPVDKYLPTEDGEPPLARAKKEDWNVACPGERMEYNTMPGWAGSSWYFLRYLDANNPNELAAKDKVDYWQNVDLYIGGAEHATGHLLYARFWTKFLHDKGVVPYSEPFKKMINQGMILGRSSFVYCAVKSVINTGRSETNTPPAISSKTPVFISKKHYDLIQKRQKLISNNQDVDINTVVSLQNLESDAHNLASELTKQAKLNQDGATGRIIIDIENAYPIHVDISLVNNDVLDIEAFKKSREEYANAEFILEDFKYICGSEVEKMSKSKFNVQTPDELVERYGADTLRMYEMFLGPLEQYKPWDTKGISGVNSFLRKLWRLFHNAENELTISEEAADKKALKTIHATIKKIQADLDRYSFNTVVSGLMICVNELTTLKCNNREVLEPLVVLLSSYAPHISEELWEKLGNTTSVTDAEFPTFNPALLVEDAFSYPVSFNGKMRFKLELPATLTKDEIEKEVMALEQTQNYLDGSTPKKVIIVPKKIINIVH
jgi:leucyl-tRNA synthetase